MSSTLTGGAYKALEISEGASQQEIKVAYRRLALVHHPDKNPNNPEATAKFQEISAAYETLGDPASKAKYDASFQSPRSSSSSPGNWWGSDSDDSFNFGSNAHGFVFSFDFSVFNYDFNFGHHRRQPQAETEEEFEFRQFFQRRQRQEEVRQARAAAARARAEAELEAAIARQMAKEAEENRIQAQKMQKMKEERKAQEKIWEQIHATTSPEKQANCLHTGFWPKEHQKKKFKCQECGQKRGMTAFKCPYCAVMICQVCLNKKMK